MAPRPLNLTVSFPPGFLWWRWVVYAGLHIIGARNTARRLLQRWCKIVC